MATNYSPNIPMDNLVLHFDCLDKVSYSSGSTTWADLSGNDNDGTLSDGTIGTVSGSERSMAFDGAGNNVLVSGCDLGTAGVAYVCWFRTSTDQNNTYLVAQGKNLTGSNGYDLGFHGANFGSYCVTTSGAASNVLVATDFHDGNWHCGAAAYNEVKNQVYYDGARIGTGGNASGGVDIESTNRLTIGSWVNIEAGPGGLAKTEIAMVSCYSGTFDSTYGFDEVFKQYFNNTRARFGV